jgi:hypothetical protein
VFLCIVESGESPMSEASQMSVLERPVPDCAHTRLLIYSIRRMAEGGLNDAFAANALLSLFGSRVRRPLLLLRALMAEMARASQNQITVAPCCCRRMTAAETELLTIIVTSRDRPRFAHARMSHMLGVDHAFGALSSAQAVAQAFADLGRPLALQSLAEAEPAFPID